MTEQRLRHILYRQYRSFCDTWNDNRYTASYCWKHAKKFAAEAMEHGDLVGAFINSPQPFYSHKLNAHPN